jgi:hypothetical protein
MCFPVRRVHADVRATAAFPSRDVQIRAGDIIMASTLKDNGEFGEPAPRRERDFGIRF